MVIKRIGIEYDTNYTPDGDVFIRADLIGHYLDEVLTDARTELLVAGGRNQKRKIIEGARTSLFDVKDPDWWTDISPEAFSVLVKKRKADIIATISAEDAHDCIAIEIERKETDNKFIVNNISVSYESWDSLMEYLAGCGLITKKRAKNLRL